MLNFLDWRDMGCIATLSGQKFSNLVPSALQTAPRTLGSHLGGNEENEKEENFQLLSVSIFISAVTSLKCLPTTIGIRK